MERQIEVRRKISVSSLQKILFIDIEKIVYCKANRQYSELHLASEETVLSTKSLAYYEKELTNCGFLRVHRTYLINLLYVKEYIRDREEIVLTNKVGIKLAEGMKGIFLAGMLSAE